ncbi:MAG TPA: aminopeptidase P family N-terminal domain-containing protein [Phototrophicaceae bacterium]|nr:aminopeptidase P family N-terminal domain-containing protein [Phototrophicaceae bacterium]
MYRPVELTSLTLPDFGLPTVEPTIPADLYRARLKRLIERASAEGDDVFVVYGDREHFANMAYLTGYDPRFEEALLIVNLKADTKPLLLVGNEGRGYVNVSPIKDDFEIVLYQNFSLLGQPRNHSRKLDEILRAGGVEYGKQVGAAGWKYYAESNQWLEIPGYIVDALRDLTGGADHVRNATHLLMDASHGLRATNEVEQLAAFEFAATFASQSVRNVVFGVQPGMTELEAAELMRLNGFPESTYTFLASGARAVLGMISPSLNRIALGDRFTVCCGLWGALTSRAGFVVENAQQLPADASAYVDTLVAPYFQAIVAWYERVGIGVTGGELYQAIHDKIGDPFFGVGLNPGHLIHLDEWLNSPIYAGSSERLQSGMALQVDVIPATGTAYFTTNIEDGIALADDDLRAAFAQQYPEAWGRIQARRAFMQNALGITLKPEVLPFSNIPAYLPPYLLAPQKALRAV